MRLTSLLSYSILPSLLLATVACGGGGGDDDQPDPTNDAKFSSATELQRQRAIIAGSGNDAAIGFLMGAIYTAPGEASCPSLRTDGATVTATFNCDDDNGQRVDGVIRATNLASLFGEPRVHDPAKDQVVELDGYAIHGATAEDSNALDGRIVIHPDTSMDVELQAALNGISVFTDATFKRTGDLTVATSGSVIDLDGVGSAAITGSWNLSSDAPAGTLTLTGKDALVADVGNAVDGCVPLTVDGAAGGSLCLNQSE